MISCVITYYCRAVMPIQTFHATKKQAQAELSKDIKDISPRYKNSGYIKKGSVKKGCVQFEHPCYGVDYLAKIEQN